MRGLFVLALLIVGFVYFCGVFVIDDGFGVYLKRSPGFEDVYFDAGKPPYNLERLILMTNQRYSLLLVSYRGKDGLRLFRSLPALP